jgi:serine/threonine-protein kinase RsbT
VNRLTPDRNIPVARDTPTSGPIRVEITANEDIVIVRQRARETASGLGFSLTDVTKIVTAASELARNTLEHGGGGFAEIEIVREGKRTAIRMEFVDSGPGIANIERALQDGFTTGKGLGLGLGGSKRLMGDIAINSEPGKGTRISVIRWR